MKTKIWRFSPVIYPFSLLICKYIPDVTDKELKERFYIIGSNHEPGEATEQDFRGKPTSSAATIQVVDKTDGTVSILIILFHLELVDDSAKAHEALHFTTMLGDWLGFPKIELENDELYAYIIGWAANCIGSVTQNTPKQMKGELYG